MRRNILLSVIILGSVFLAACSTSAESSSDSQVTVYKSATCGCCSDWVSYLEDNGFAVTTIETEDMATVKDNNAVPLELRACHTALIDGYVVEGHVPVDEIKKLVEEKPNILGIAVAGMPPGSPGMDIPGFETDPFDVVSFDADGNVEIFAQYPKD